MSFTERNFQKIPLLFIYLFDKILLMLLLMPIWRFHFDNLIFDTRHRCYLANIEQIDIVYHTLPFAFQQKYLTNIYKEGYKERVI